MRRWFRWLDGQRYRLAARVERRWRWPCWFAGHQWRYFVDGFVCRACRQCKRVQYDLPMVGGDDR